MARRAAPARGRGRGRTATRKTAAPSTPTAQHDAATHSAPPPPPVQPGGVRDGVIGPHNMDPSEPTSRFDSFRVDRHQAPTLDGMRIFRSHFDTHVLMMPPKERPYRDQWDRLVWPKGRDLKFKDHLFRTKDPEEIAFIESSKAWNAGVITDAVVERNERLKKSFEQWKAEILTDPALLEDLRSQIGEDDFAILEMLSRKQRKEPAEKLLA